MITNFCTNYQFNTRLYLNNEILECIGQIRLLGVEISENMTWKANTTSIIRKEYSRMSLLTKLVCFKIPKEDLVTIYILYIRSLLEYCAVVWHSSITEEEVTDLERIQKCSVRLILQEEYTDYPTGLETLSLTELSKRREQLCLDFAKITAQNPRTKHWFPINQPNDHNVRNHKTYFVTHASTERFRMSTIPYLQRMLNTIT